MSSINRNPKIVEFMTIHWYDSTSGCDPKSASWLEPIVTHQWFIETVRCVVSRRRRHAPRADIIDLQHSLISRFIELASGDSCLGQRNFSLESLLDRIEKCLDTCARHLFCRENQLQWHRSRKGVARHIESSSIPGIFEEPCNTIGPMEHAIANERIGEIALALASLTVAERYVLVARYMGSKKQSTREIREALGVSKHGVELLNKNGLQKMRLALRHLDD